MIRLDDKANCCGCGACVAKCPTKALTMQKDCCGFVYPKLDESLCVHCNLCEKTCLYQSRPGFPEYKAVYAAAAGDCDLRESASGGIFASIAGAILNRGGVVCGAVLSFEEGIHVQHTIITKKEELLPLKGSKYVQSDICNCFSEIRSHLDSGTVVLFCGTPCQVTGLKGYLQKEYDSLFCLDLVCHGVPSEQLFQDYIRFIEKKNQFKVKHFSFRDKSKGWVLHGRMETKTPSGQEETIYFPPEGSSYYQLFLDGFIYRENCYSCPYPGNGRPGDLTLGDYWGIEIVHPELLCENGGTLEKDKGISALLVNTEKGSKLLELCTGITLYKSDFEKASRYNKQFVAASALKPERETVLSLYAKGYSELEKWYSRRLRLVHFKRRVRKIVPKGFKRIVKKMIKKN